MDWDKGHPTDDMVERYSLGALQSEDEVVFEEHMLLCELCQQRVSDTDDYIRAMRTAATRMERSSSITKLTKPPLARSFLPIPFAGALAAGVLAIVFIAPRGEPLVGTAQLSLAATRGVQAEALSPSIPPNHRISMQLDTQALPVSDSYKVRLVDSAGTLLWEAPAMVRDGSMAVDYPAGCEPGRYWVRVFNGRNELLREYGFLVTDRAQPASPSR